MQIDHHSVLHTRREMVFADGEWKNVLVVSTSLQIDPLRPDYDAEEESALQVAIVDFMKAHSAVVDSVYVRSMRADA